jgi:hypothetical protein
MRRLALTIPILLLSTAHVPAQEKAETLTTAAGELVVFRVESSGRCGITLGGKAILDADCQYHYAPRVLGHFKGGIRPFDEVVVLQDSPMGNACNGGPLWFLGINRDGSHKISEKIDFCGGRDPVVKRGADRVTVLLPGGPPNRGKGYIPSETWVYQDGKVRQLKAGKK